MVFSFLFVFVLFLVFAACHQNSHGCSVFHGHVSLTKAIVIRFCRPHGYPRGYRSGRSNNTWIQVTIESNGHCPFENDNPRHLSLIIDSDKNKRAIYGQISSDIVHFNLYLHWLYLIRRIIKCTLRNVAKIPRGSFPSILFGIPPPVPVSS